MFGLGLCLDYAIVIPACDTSPRCRELMETVLSSIRWGGYTCPVVVAYDNCSEEFQDYCDSQLDGIYRLPYTGSKNLNFCANANRGLQYVYEKFGCGSFLLNMDTCLPHRLHLEKIINSGISSPVGEHIAGSAVQKFSTLNRINDPASCGCARKTVEEGALGTPTKKFAAFCMWVSPQALNTIGYLDQDTFVASFEDDDYAVRACLAGLPVEQFGVKIHHELDPMERAKQISTTGSYNIPQLGDHMVRFMKKWGIPMQVPHSQFADWIVNNRSWDPKYKVTLQDQQR